MEKPLYFAYGSNINLDQMQYRCPDATVYGQAVLDNYDLRFRGSGVATVIIVQHSQIGRAHV